MSKHHTGVRSRKQHFPRTDRRRVSGSLIKSDQFYSAPSPPNTVNQKTDSPPKHNAGSSGIEGDGASRTTVRMERKARDEHNEQERNRRRELAIIYELIRCNFSMHDLRFLNQNECPRSIDRLSYPQVLHVAYHIMKEEQHNIALYEKSINTVERLEKEMKKAGMNPPKRPSFPSPMENYRKVIQVVDNLLKHDKSARSSDGSYEVTPTDRAAMGDRQLAFLNQRRQALFARDSFTQFHGGSRGFRRRPLRRQHHVRSVDDTIWNRTHQILKRPASMDSFGHIALDESHFVSDPMMESLSNIDILSSKDDNIDESSDSTLEVQHSFKPMGKMNLPCFY